MNSHNFKMGTTQGQSAYAALLDNDLEHDEFRSTFRTHAAVSGSMLFEEPSYFAFLNFSDDEQEKLYAQEAESLEDDDDEENPEQEPDEQDRESYKNTDQDGMYYFI